MEAERPGAKGPRRCDESCRRGRVMIRVLEPIRARLGAKRRSLSPVQDCTGDTVPKVGEVTVELRYSKVR